jgi:NADPH-dependent 2,4-dienoyl-CoA reductase/sulfur reductase-like enzyme
MTLKEKFKQIDIKLSENHSTKIVEVEAEIIEKIADEFAIGFAEWIIEKEREYPNRIIRGKELLEIYKKEKGL